MTCELFSDEARGSDEGVTRCASCPRGGEPRLRAVENFGAPGGFLLETAWLCDGCALLREDVL